MRKTVSIGKFIYWRIGVIKDKYIPIIALALVVAGVNAYAQGQAPSQEGYSRNTLSDRHETNQTFDGQAFTKDNNIWAYTAAFAEIFGMSKDGVDNQLVGIEAIAFRIEDPGYRLCGMGGKVEQCMNQNRCMLDVYIDERKHPLPWLHPEQKADWHWRYSSSFFLRTPTEKDGAPIKETAEFVPNRGINRTSTLHPFADPVSRKEVAWFTNARSSANDGHGGDLVLIWGFKRNVIAGLTILSLSQGCTLPNDSKRNSSIVFRLESRDSMTGPTIKNFHEFSFPATFSQKIQEAIQLSKEANARY
jgi:hypothetical protein